MRAEKALYDECFIERVKRCYVNPLEVGEKNYGDYQNCRM